MTISGVLVRFSALYAVLSVLLITGFALTDFKPVSGLNTSILIASVMWSCMRFAELNRRNFTIPEKRKVTWSMIGIDALFQLVGAGLAMGFVRPFPWGALVAGLAFVVALHAFTIFMFVRLSGKTVTKRLEKLAAQEMR